MFKVNVDGFSWLVQEIFGNFTYSNFISRTFCNATKFLPLYFSQVALRDLQMRGMPSNLLPGEPLCSPRTTVLLESTVQLLRRLHQCDQWASHINQYIHTHLELIGPLLKEDDFNAGQTLTVTVVTYRHV